jgi:hypothetical protein
VAEGAHDGVAALDEARHGAGVHGVPGDERDAAVELVRLRLLADERGDLVAGGERLRHELAADAARRPEDRELHDATRVAGSAAGVAAGSGTSPAAAYACGPSSVSAW